MSRVLLGLLGLQGWPVKHDCMENFLFDHCVIMKSLNVILHHCVIMTSIFIVFNGPNA